MRIPQYNTDTSRFLEVFHNRSNIPIHNQNIKHSHYGHIIYIYIYMLIHHTPFWKTSKIIETSSTQATLSVRNFGLTAIVYITCLYPSRHWKRVKERKEIYTSHPPSPHTEASKGKQERTRKIEKRGPVVVSRIWTLCHQLIAARLQWNKKTKQFFFSVNAV